MLLAFSGFDSSKAAGDAYFEKLHDVSEALWNSSKLKEPDRRRVYFAIRDVPPAYAAFLTLIDGLALDEDTKERLRFRLVKLMDDLTVLGANSALTPAGRKFAQGLQANEANDLKVEGAADKNAKMRQAIKDEAAALSLGLADSAECAGRLQPGVKTRMKVSKDAEGKEPKGYSTGTIRAQIRLVLKERGQFSKN